MIKRVVFLFGFPFLNVISRVRQERGVCGVARKSECGAIFLSSLCSNAVTGKQRANARCSE